jgi:hypothetical protein
MLIGNATYCEVNMVDTSHLRQTLDHYRKQRQQKIDEIRPVLNEVAALDVLIRKLADDAGEPANIQPFNIEGAATPSVAASGPASPVTGRHSLRPDEFFGMTQTDAARSYLKTVKRAITFDELISALRSGGCPVGGADPKRTLYVSLSRNPKKEFVFPSKEHVGLAEFYESRK